MTPILNVSIDTRRAEGVIVARLEGELDLSSAPLLERELGEACSRPHRLVLLDLRRLEFIDSSGVRAIVAAHDRASATGSRLAALCAPDGAVRKILVLTGLEERLSEQLPSGDLLASAEPPPRRKDEPDE